MKKLYYLFTFIVVACGAKHAEKDFFDAVAANDVPLEQPKPTEWLYEHHELGQTFDAYKNTEPLNITTYRDAIFIKPLGNFTPQQNKILQYTVDYLAIFFQTKAMLLPTSSDSIIPNTARRMRTGGNEQLLASYILNPILKNSFPKHGVVYMAITAKDLYPSPDWNFVFGLASYEDKLGVSSIKRLNSNVKDSGDYRICLRRLIQVASHEIGHMFSLHHCIHAKCVMNGSNTLPETDGQPNRLCSECLKKLSWNLQFDNKKRLMSLRNYFLQHHLQFDYQIN